MNNKIKEALEALIKSAEQVSSHLATLHEEVPSSRHPCRIVDRDIGIAKTALAELSQPEGHNANVATLSPREKAMEEAGNAMRKAIVNLYPRVNTNDTKQMAAYDAIHAWTAATRTPKAE